MNIKEKWRRPGSLSLILWIFAYAGLAFTILSAGTAGYLVAPFALIFFLAVLVFAHFWPEAPLGGFTGIGLLLLLIAFLSRDYVPCPDGPVILYPGEPPFHCGGMNTIPWLVAGLFLTGVGVFGYFLFMVRKKSSRWSKEA